MSATKTFVEDALKGGWCEGYHLQNYGEFGDVLFVSGIRSKALVKSEILLSPVAWQAVGKARGWSTHNTACNKCGVPFNGWKGKMHGLIDALSEGKSIEDYLTSIEKV